MNTYELSDEEIIDLIFEKKVCVKNISVRSKHSFLTILAKLDQRLRDENIVKTEEPIFSDQDEETTGALQNSNQLTIHRRKKIYSAA